MALSSPAFLAPLRSRGPSLVAALYSWDDAALRLAGIYANLLEGSRSRQEPRPPGGQSTSGPVQTPSASASRHQFRSVSRGRP